jgi:poly(hydroxyalkanoate) granule associated protein phasin
MARKTASRQRPQSGPDETLGQSAQKIWLAGLGALERAKSEGPKMFDTLVEQGRGLGARARDAIERIGVLTGREVEDLTRQVGELNASVRELMSNGARGAPGRAKRAAPRKAKRAAKASTKRPAKAKRKTRARTKTAQAHRS